MINRPYICLSIRHLHLEDYVNDHNHMGRPIKSHLSLGEGLYTLTTTNFKWPNGVSYLEMMEARTSVIQGLRNG